MQGLKKISILLILILSEITYSQYENIKFSSLTVNDGLSEDCVSSVVQDDQGFMWFGTPSGLNRYDGYNFKIYSHDPNKSGSISSNYIFRLYIDKEGTLWIGTQDGGLDRYDRNLDKFTVFKHNPSDSSSISENTVRSIFEDSKGYLWVGTAYNGIDRFDKKSNVFTHYKFIQNDSSGISYNSVWAICEDNFQNIWIGTTFSGLYKLNVNTGKFIQFTNNPADQNSLSGKTVRFLTLDRNQNLWIGTWDGLDELPLKELNDDSPGSVKFKRYYIDKTELWGSRFESICIDEKGKFWLGTFKGLAVFDPETEHFTAFTKNSYNGLIGEAVNSIFEDNSGIIWFAVGAGIVMPSGSNIQHLGGINIFDRKRMRFKSYLYKPGLPNSLNLGFITSLAEDEKGDLWITNGEPSIWKWKKQDNVLTKIIPNSIGQKFIVNLFINSKNEMWVTAGPNSEICKLNPSTGDLVRYYTNIAPEAGLAYLGKNGCFYETSRLGLFEFDCDMNLLRVYKHDENDTNSLDNNWINDFVCEDKDTNLWVSTVSGLNKLDKKTGKFFHYRCVIGDSNSINCINVVAMYDDGSNIWFATYGGGLNKFNKISSRFTHITKDNGFADNFMSSLLADNSGKFWIGSNSGISKYNPLNGKIKNYDIEDGLQGKEFVLPAFKSKSGEMFFCGYYGLTTFFSDSISDNRHIPPVILTMFKLFDKAAILDTFITYKKEITLPYDSNFFSFEFAALDYTNPSKNRYEYKLEGVDKDWIYTDASDRTVNYTDINPGNYTFRVKGSNNDGLWNEEGASVRIIITPPWWKRLWFRIFSLSMLLAIFGGTIRYVSVQKLRRKLELEKERLRISNDMHDEVGSSLTRITLLSELAKRKLGDTEEIKRISDASRAVVNSMDEIVWAVNPKYDSLDNLAAYILQYAQEFFEVTGISCRFEFPDSIPGRHISSEIRHHVFLVIKEALNNIVKHSGADSVNIKLTVDDNNFEFIISDNGKGFKMDERDQFSNGLNNMQNRITEITGTFNIESQLCKGTRIIINIPA